ncbi:uncharacterized protein A1O9_08956 [Exophiala aquamarina CBS 119918]|uniref:Uncharacterized protein n=1 Tax=Exophiala aquamarina CBS 119918 TaxID=1182545 RepID=A0A072P6I1_9EURO|nr:uncharacterized protein A1O9_08956 [Exophiala aquamarina CBS 119918]KEF55302.1 hypothetical protein A1O9_08956 [Exophiala aquamarina CBS 119918]
MTRPVISSLLGQNDTGEIGRQRRRQPSIHYSRAGPQDTSTSHARQNSQRGIGKGHQTFSTTLQRDDYGVRFGSKVSNSQDTQAFAPQDRPTRPQNRQLLSDDLSDHSMLLDRCGNIAVPSVNKQKTWSILSPRDNARSTPTGTGKRSGPAKSPSTLIPLNEARHLSSFDLVHQRSAPSLRKVRSTSTPQPTPARLDHSTEEVLNSSINRQADLSRNDSTSSPASEAFADGQYISPLLQERIDNEQAPEQTKGTDASPRNSCLREYRFTIDEQVELELMSNTTGTLCSDPVGTRTRSVEVSHVGCAQGTPPTGTAAGPCNKGAGARARIAPELASDRHKVERPQVYTAALEERAAKPLSPPSLWLHAEVTDLSFASCYDSDSEAWLGYIFPDNMHHDQSGFFFGNAPQICPRDQKKSPPHHQRAENANGLTKLFHQHDSRAMSQPHVTASTVSSTNDTMIFAPGPSVPCSRMDFPTEASPVEGYFTKKVENRSMYNSPARDEWGSGILATTHVWHEIEPVNTFPTQVQPKFPPKRKASDVSQSKWFPQTATDDFEPRERQRGSHEHTPKVMPWGTTRNWKANTENQGFAVAQNDVSNNRRKFHRASERYLEKAGGQESSPFGQFESTKSKLGAGTSYDGNPSHEYALASSPSTALPNTRAKTIAENYVQLWSAGSNSQCINDCTSSY